MSKSLKNKVNNLENHVLQRFQTGSTQFCAWALPETEQVLLEAARKLALAQIPYNELTLEQKAILNSAHDLLRARIFDLFTSYLAGLLCRDDKIAYMKVHERFLWFIRELAKEVDQELEVAEIEKQASPEDEVDRVDEYYRKAPPVFTLESWEKLQDELFQEIAQRPGFKEWLESTIKKHEKVKK